MDEKTKRTRKGQWTLLTELTETEKAERASELATLFTERGETADKKKNAVKDFNDQLSELDLQIAVIVAELKDGMHQVLTDVETVLDDPTDGIATVYRVSDRKVLEVRPMTPGEKQPDLFCDEVMEKDDTVHRVQIATPDEPEIDEDLKDDPEDIEDLEDLEIAEDLYSTAEEEESAEEPATKEEEHVQCSKCRMSVKKSEIVHVNNGKAMCWSCLHDFNAVKFSKLDRWKENGLEIRCRVAVGYGCAFFFDCTCFRFATNQPADVTDGHLVCTSWGNHIYAPGDYADNESKAHELYQQLKASGVIMEGEEDA